LYEEFFALLFFGRQRDGGDDVTRLPSIATLAIGRSEKRSNSYRFQRHPKENAESFARSVLIG
jgi:hypothetical protein